MGKRQTTRQDGAQQARPHQTAPAVSATASAMRGRQAEGSVNGVAGLLTNQREHTLACGPLQLLGAEGVRNPEQSVVGQEGVAAGVWLCQPTGEDVPGLCLTDGRAEPARSGADNVPPAKAGRLVPRTDWRGDARGRNHRRSGAQLACAKLDSAKLDCAQFNRCASARREAGTRQHARCADGAGRPSLDALQMAVFTRISGVQFAASGSSALPEVAPCAAWASRDFLSNSRSSATRSSQAQVARVALPVLDVTSTLQASRSDEFGRRVVHHGRVSVPHTFGRAGRPAVDQEHHYGEPDASRRPWPWDQFTNCAPAERVVAAGAVRHSREGLADWRLRRVPHASRRHADHPGSWDTWRSATRWGSEAPAERAVPSAWSCECDLRDSAGCRGLERDPRQHSWLRGGWTPGVSSPSLLQHLEVVAGAGSRSPARSASTGRSSAWWAETGAAPLTVRTLVRRIMPVFHARSVPVSVAVERSKSTGVRP
jgi:hypothetical protein